MILPTSTHGILKSEATSMLMKRYGFSPCRLREQVHKMTIVFEPFIDLGGPIYDQMIRNKKRQKIIAKIRAIKFQK